MSLPFVFYSAVSMTTAPTISRAENDVSESLILHFIVCCSHSCATDGED